MDQHLGIPSRDVDRSDPTPQTLSLKSSYPHRDRPSAGEWARDRDKDRDRDRDKDRDKDS